MGLKMIRNTLLVGSLWVLFGLTACGKNDAKDQHNTVELKTVKPVSTDASLIATQVYQFLSQAERLVATLDPANSQQFDQQIFNPVNTLLTRWRLEVKQSDSVAGDQFTICRGALVSLDAWARSVVTQSSNIDNKKQVFENQKQLCGKAVLDHS